MNGKLVQHYLEATTRLFPKKIAVTDGQMSVTFEELSAKSNRLAKFLVKVGILRQHRVVYFLPRCIDCIVSTMAILQSGASYIPLDQKTPIERWNRILIDAEPRAIICNEITLAETIEWVERLEFSISIICLNPSDEHLKSERQKIYYYDDMSIANDGHLSLTGCSDDVAYVLYTSGSTGLPKGVMVTHGNIRNYIDWATEYFRISSQDRILGTAPFHFDMSTFDIYCSLATGATLCIARESLLLFPQKLVHFMETEKVTLWKGVSSLLMYMCRAGVLHKASLQSLRTVIFAGEPLDAKYLRTWMEMFPSTSFFNGYGPTEATGISLCHHVKSLPELGQSIPIGRPCKGAQIVLVDENGAPVRPGEVGELCIAGECLARGYLNDLEKTQKSFTPPPPGLKDLGARIYHTGDLVRQTSDGEFVFVSRKDYQVKWMGHRIELGEIESNVMAYPGIQDAVVLIINADSHGLTELTAFFESDDDVDVSSLFMFMKKRVPIYMIPKRFIRINSLPRNDRGKISRDFLLRLYSEKNA
jgi:amino acid adenylation domain-containing protein